MDTLTGTNGSDVFTADNSGTDTITAADTINGGEGSDTLVVYSDGGVVANANLSSVETLRVYDLDDGQTLTNTNFASLTSVELVRGDGTATLALGANVNSVSFSDIAVAAAGTVVTADDDLTAITVNTANITDGGVGSDITVNGAALVDYTVNVTDDTTVDLLDLDAAETIAINATGALTTVLATTGTAALTITGSGDVDLGELDADVDTITSTATGALTAAIGANSDTVLTAGSGDDTITASTTDAIASTATLAVDGGAGTDTLIIGDASDINSAADGARYTNFEILDISNTQDASLVSGITGLVLNAMTSKTVSGISAAAAENITVKGNQGTAVTLTLDDATGSADVVSLDLSSATATTNVDVAGLSVIGVETLNLNAGTGTAGTDSDITFANVDTSDLTAITVTGSADTKITTTNLDAVLTLDASALTGDFTVLGALSAGSTVTSGTGDDTATVSSTLGVAYSMGAGDDGVTAAVATLVADGEDDTSVDGGAGTDTLTISDDGATLTDNHFTYVSGMEKLTLADGSSSITAGAAFAAAFADGVVITNAALADTETFTYAGGLYTGDTTVTLTSAAVANGDAEDITITTGAGADTISLTAEDWVGEDANAGDIRISTGAGDDVIEVETGTIADDNDGVLRIDAGKGADTIERVDGANGSGAAAYFTYIVEEGDSLTTGYDQITGYLKGDGTDLSDVIDFGDGAVSDGLTSEDYGVITSHSITDGVVTFDDAAVFATALVIDSTNLAAVLGYLNANADTDDVVAFAFDSDDSGSADATMVWHKGDSVNDMVLLVGVTGIDDVTAGASTGANDVGIG